MSLQQSIILTFVISLIWCGIGIWAYPIYILDEAKNAEAAREMLHFGEWIVPTFNKLLRTDKPPLHYYFMILGYKIFGVNALGARFFSSVFGALTMTTTFYFANKFASKSVAWISNFLMWSAIFFVQEFHLAVPDPYLIFFTSLGLWLFYDYINSPSNRSLVLLYMCFGLGVLSKGPVALVLPAGIAFTFLITTAQFRIRTILSFKPILGIIFILMLTLPWYIQVHLDTQGGWTKGFFLDHNWNRFGNAMEGHGGIFLLTWLFVILGMMPFAFYAIRAFSHAYSQRTTDHFLWFSACTAAVFILFFSFSGTKLPNYTMPCYPFLSVCIAMALDRFAARQKKDVYTTIVVLLICLLGLLLPIGGKIALSVEEELRSVSNTAYWLIPTALFGCVGTVYYFKNQFQKAFLTIAMGWMLLAPFLFMIIYPQLTAQSPVVQSKKLLQNASNILVYKRFDPAFPFNYRQTYEVAHTLSAVKYFFSKHPNGYVLTNEKNKLALQDLKRINLQEVFSCKALFENHTTRIFKTERYLN